MTRTLRSRHLGKNLISCWPSRSSRTPRRHRFGAVFRAKKVLEPDGIFAATFFPGEENYTGTEWVYPGCVYYTFEYFSKLAADEGLACKALNWTHTNQQKWVALTHPEHASAVPELADVARIGVLQHQVDALQKKLNSLQKLKGLKLLKKINRLFYGKGS